MTRHQKPAVDSTHHLVASQLQDELPPPADLPKLTKRERAAWSQWVRARTDWRDSDLRMLHQAVKLESDWFKVARQARRAPAVCTSPNGGLLEHPVHKVARATFKQYQDALRFLGLNTRPAANVAASARGGAAGSNRGKRGLLKSV